jgi:gluconate 5-dehydrogenase
VIKELFGLEGKIALVTGSARGLGFTIAQGMARAGATIIINDVVEDRIKEAEKAFRDQGLNAFGALFDITDAAAVATHLTELERDVGPIDILFNNAGIQIRHPLEEFPEEEWERIIRVNLTGVFLVSKYAAKGMIQRRHGKIIHMCSMQSELGRPTITPYAASKGGVKMLVRGMATEWGKHNIQVNGIGPGYFITEMTRALVEDEKFNSWLCGRTPANRWGDPSELVGAAIFLASKASDYVNGHVLYVDGGMLACV